ncbi:IucA/IucC family protein [Paenibacillus baimaensis]|nr:IucA/IucC family protein [Paenibacillus sp. WQ 127069]
MLHPFTALATQAEGSLGLAEQAALRGLLNSYLRETGIFDPRDLGATPETTGTYQVGTAGAGVAYVLDTEDPSEAGQQTEASDRITTQTEKHNLLTTELELLLRQASGESLIGAAFVLPLPLTQAMIAGIIEYYSITGQHRYGTSFYIISSPDSKSESASRQIPVASGPRQIMDLLLAEVSFREQEATRESRSLEMSKQIGNSIRRMALYLERAQLSGTNVSARPLDYIRSEQSMLYGHPFHPTPKSSEGFTDLELVQYAPEMGAVFALHYMAVSKELIREEWIGQRPALPAAVQEAAQHKLGSRIDAYSLLPLHPWQMKYVCAQPLVAEFIRQDKLVDLGPISQGQGQAQAVYPTSSVRTVWDPQEQMFYKLPLHVRITNFIRENTTEQVRRTMDAAIVLQAFQSGSMASASRGMHILAEVGYQTIDFPGVTEPEREQLLASFAVVYREAAQLTTVEQAACFVLAALLEQPPGSDEPLLFTAARQSNDGVLPDWQVWLTAYLELSMLPLIRLYTEAGISLEAHVQNSLVTLEKELPVRYYVRDLEGISVNRCQAEKHGWTPQLIPTGSPVLYTETEAWERLKYYFFVNHLGALIHTIARINKLDEGFYWHTVRSVLLKELAVIDAASPSGGYIHDLLENPDLPAKANLISRFQERSETPDYVPMRNPIYESGRNP